MGLVRCYQCSRALTGKEEEFCQECSDELTGAQTMTDQTCSQGHVRHPPIGIYRLAYRCREHDTSDAHFTCGTLIGQECKEAPQEEKVEPLVFSHEEKKPESICPYCKEVGWTRSKGDCGCPCHHPTTLRQVAAFESTIRAKDALIHHVFCDVHPPTLEDEPICFRCRCANRLKRAEQAEARIKALEKENGRLREAVRVIKEKSGTHTVSAHIFGPEVDDPGYSGIYAVAEAALTPPKETPNAKR